MLTIITTDSYRDGWARDKLVQKSLEEVLGSPIDPRQIVSTAEEKTMFFVDASVDRTALRDKIRELRTEDINRFPEDQREVKFKWLDRSLNAMLFEILE